MTKLDLQLVALEDKRLNLEKQLEEIKTQITNLRKSYIKKNYGLKVV